MQNNDNKNKKPDFPPQGAPKGAPPAGGMPPGGMPGFGEAPKPVITGNLPGGKLHGEKGVEFEKDFTRDKTGKRIRMGGPGPGRGPGGPGGMPGEKARDFSGTLKKLIKYLSPFRLAILLIIFITISSTMFNIVGPRILGSATSTIYAGLVDKISGGIGVDFAKVGSILLKLLALYLLSASLGYLQQFVMAGMTTKISYNMRKEFCDKIERLPMSFFDTMTNGEVLSRVTNDVDTITQSVGMILSQVISSIITFVGVLAMMLSINWIMTITALCIIPLSTLIMSMVVKRSQKYFTKQFKFRGEANSQIEENYSGHIIVKAFNKEESVVKTFNETADGLADSQLKAQFLSSLMMPLTGFVGNLNYVLQSVLGAYFVIKGRILVGDIQAFTQYVRNLNQPINQFSQIVNMLQSTIAASERVFEFFEAEEEEPSSKEPLPTENIKGQVDFEHVRFGYTEDSVVIKDFNATVKPGQMVALVGPTGAGKTTMVKLLMRFYELNGGCIKVDGHNINEYDRDALRKVFGMVLQDTWLFNGTIMENIRYSNMDATDEDVIAAAKAARVHHFVSTLPKGYNMELNEEASNVSAGQKQLLTIARAILADPKILILDEATSSVDTRTEILIQEAMDHLMENRTSFVIAHRLSTIRNADLILVINEGDIVEQGTHDELIAQNGFYAQLYQSQFEDVG